MNLAEGNIVSNIVIDDSHGKNGPLNTFFRNRATGYGVFMNFAPATDSMQFIGNEITNNTTGLYFINGTGHFSWANNYRGRVLDGATSVPDTSLYLNSRVKPLCATAWPMIGQPNSYNTGSIYAKDRLTTGTLASCSCPTTAPLIVSGATAPRGFAVYPNPADDYFRISGEAPFTAALYDSGGRLVLSGNGDAATRFSVQQLRPGVYMLRIVTRSEVIMRRLVVSR